MQKYKNASRIILLRDCLHRVVLGVNLNSDKDPHMYLNYYSSGDKYTSILHMGKDDEENTNFKKWIKVEAKQSLTSGQFKLQVDFTTNGTLTLDARNPKSTSYTFTIDNPSPRRGLMIFLNFDNANFQGKVRNVEFKTEVADARHELNN